MRSLKFLWLFGCLVFAGGLQLATSGIWLNQPLNASKAVPDGHAYTVRLTAPTLLGLRLPDDAMVAVGDRIDTAERSATRLFEDGRELGPAHSQHAEIRALGEGRFSHWEQAAGERMLLFSSSDGSDSRNNGRRYQARLHYLVGDGWSRPLNWLLYALGIGLAIGWIVILRQSGLSLRGPALLALGTSLSAVAAVYTTGVLFLLFAFTAAALATILALRLLLGLLSKQWHDRIMQRSGSVALVFASVALALVLVEAGLWLLSVRPDLFAGLQPMSVAHRSASSTSVPLESIPAEVRDLALKRRGHVTMPEAWQQRDVEVKGAKHAFYWHDALHVLDEHGFRSVTPLPPQRHPNRFRILILGDSLTYGYGIDARWGYPQVLERKLAASARVEVINLGVGGDQSEDVLRVLRSHYEELRPDLVVYGICLNDFLDSGQRQSINLPVVVPEFIQQRTHLGRWLQDLIPATSRALGFAVDFYGEILNDVDHYQVRFAHDLKAMNDFVAARGGGPIVAIVLNQFPGLDPRSEQLTRMAEAAAHAAGMDVVATDAYAQTWSGFNFRVSPWEGHPNEIANELFADLLYRHIEGCCGMEEYDLGGD